MDTKHVVCRDMQLPHAPMCYMQRQIQLQAQLEPLQFCHIPLVFLHAPRYA